MESTQKQLHWYRMPLVWMLILIPASAVMMGIIMIWLAITTNDGLVVDDYYQQGKHINKIIKRDIAAAEYGLGAQLSLDNNKPSVDIKLDAQPDFNFPDEMLVRFLHATRAGYDKTLVLTRTHGNHYVAVLPALNSGRWYVQIEANDWRLLGSISIPDQQEVHISATR